MRPLWEDILAAFWLGILLPGIVLNSAVLVGRNLPEEAEETVAQEQANAATQVLIRADDGSRNYLDLSTYLTGVLLAEMPAAFEPEALKAQAVAAGTYARKAVLTGGKHGDGSVCTAPSCCQAYLSEADYLSLGGATDSLDKVRQAVAAVSSFALVYEGELIEAVYFSCSGGATEAALTVWGADYPYLQSVESPGEEIAVYHRDTVNFPTGQFQMLLNRTLPEDRSQWFGAVEYTEGGGVASMEIAGESYTGVQLRSLLRLRSTAFDIVADNDMITIITKGYGHRVGMSQYGANAMALEGDSYLQILNHYYPGAVVVPME